MDMHLCWKIHTTSTSNHHQQPVDLRLCWKIRTTSTPNQHHQQPIDWRLCWKIRTTSTSNHHHQQPIDVRLCWKIRTTSTSNHHHHQPPSFRPVAWYWIVTDSSKVTLVPLCYVITTLIWMSYKGVRWQTSLPLSHWSFLLNPTGGLLQCSSVCLSVCLSVWLITNISKKSISPINFSFAESLHSDRRKKLLDFCEKLPRGKGGCEVSEISA